MPWWSTCNVPVRTGSKLVMFGPLPKVDPTKAARAGAGAACAD